MDWALLFGKRVDSYKTLGKIIMIRKYEKVILSGAFDDVRSAYISRAKWEAGRIADARQWMLDNGFEALDIPDGQLLADDGREILHAHGKAWALKPEIHAQRLAAAMEQARKRDAAITKQQTQQAKQANQPTTCTALIDGQLCGGTLIRAAVCPRCALGKSGVTATLTCDVCGHVTAIMKGGVNG